MLDPPPVPPAYPHTLTQNFMFFLFFKKLIKPIYAAHIYVRDIRQPLEHAAAVTTSPKKNGASLPSSSSQCIHFKK